MLYNLGRKLFAKSMSY